MKKRKKSIIFLGFCGVIISVFGIGFSTFALVNISGNIDTKIEVSAASISSNTISFSEPNLIDSYINFGPKSGAKNSLITSSNGDEEDLNFSFSIELTSDSGDFSVLANGGFYLSLDDCSFKSELVSKGYISFADLTIISFDSTGQALGSGSQYITISSINNGYSINVQASLSWEKLFNNENPVYASEDNANTVAIYLESFYKIYNSLTNKTIKFLIKEK